MDADQYAYTRNRLIMAAELARETTRDVQAFFDALALHERFATMSDVHALMMACRDFREASAAPLAALLKGRSSR